jgi:hypothetical protein
LASSLLTNGFQKDLHPGAEIWLRKDFSWHIQIVIQKIEGILRSKPNDNRNVQEEHTLLAVCWKGLFKRRQRLCRVPFFRAVSNLADLPRRGTSVRSESDLKISPCPSGFGRSQPSTSCRTKSMQKQSVAPGNL